MGSVVRLSAQLVASFDPLKDCRLVLVMQVLLMSEWSDTMLGSNSASLEFRK